MSHPKTPRGKILQVAINLTENDRNKTYGNPVENMTAYACLIEGYLRARGIIERADKAITAEDAANFLALAKMARTCDPNLPFHRDNHIDGAAYIGIAGECSEFERDPGFPAEF